MVLDLAINLGLTTKPQSHKDLDFSIRFAISPLAVA
jgi:hypothetical protein